MKIQKNVNRLLQLILKQKQTKSRPLPSVKLITNGDFLSLEQRNILLDITAALIDENPTGRSDMCIYFSCLLRYALRLLGYKAEVHLGKALYTQLNNSRNSFGWDHSWVIFGNTLIDGNVDSMVENPYVPRGIEPLTYWGNINEVPIDRSFKSERLLLVSDELDELDEEYINWQREMKSYLISEKMISK